MSSVSATKLAFMRTPWKRRDVLTLLLLPQLLLGLVYAGLLIFYQPATKLAGSEGIESISQLQVDLFSSLVGRPLQPQAIEFIDLAIIFLAELFIVAALLRWRRARLKDLGMVPVSPKTVLKYLFVIFASLWVLLIVAFTIVSLLFPEINADQPQEVPFANDPKTGAILAYSLIAVALFPGIIEEIMFRGVAFPAFAKRHGVIAGAIISSLFFALLHFQANVGIFTFILGLLLCWLYLRTGSIIPGIIVHIANNAIATLVS